jgi:hypothetical protein
MKALNIISLCLGLSILSHTAQASRMAPATIEPITTKRGVIQHSFENNDKAFSVYVLMKDKAGDLKWKSKIYGVQYVPNLETDVQDIHLKKLSLEGSSVIALDEMGRRYEVDIDSGNVLKSNKKAD